MQVLRRHSDYGSQQKLDEVAKEYELIVKQQDDFWKKRAKQHWLMYSDTSSCYFHVPATSRKKNNFFI